MKKIILATLTVFSLSLSLESLAQFKVGILAGGNKINQRINITEGSVYAGNNLKGFHAGLIGDLLLGNNFFFQPQVIYSRKGAMHLSSTGAKETRITMNYLDVPVNLVYKIDLPFGKAFAGTGASLGYAIGGKEKQGDQTNKLFTGATAWKRHDLSLNFTAGLEFRNGFFASINSQKGLLDINKTGAANIKNKSISFSAGYLLDWNKLKRKA